MEDIILLKEVQKKQLDKETNDRLVSSETQVLIQENGFRLENLQGLNAQHILSYMGKERATTRAVRFLLVFHNKRLYEFGA